MHCPQLPTTFLQIISILHVKTVENTFYCDDLQFTYIPKLHLKPLILSNNFVVKQCSSTKWNFGADHQQVNVLVFVQSGHIWQWIQLLACNWLASLQCCHSRISKSHLLFFPPTSMGIQNYSDFWDILYMIFFLSHTLLCIQSELFCNFLLNIGAGPLGLMGREPARTSEPGSNPSWNARVHSVCKTFNVMRVV